VHPKFKPNPPAPAPAILELTGVLRKPLPATYLRALATANGGQGFIGNRFVNLWPVEEIVERNKHYQVVEYAPELLLIGSNGGGVAYAFDTSQSDESIYEVPFIGLDVKDARLIAKSFEALVPAINLTRSPGKGSQRKAA